MFQNIHQGKAWVEWDPTHFKEFVKNHGAVDILIYRTPWLWLAIINKDVMGNIVPDD